MATSNDKYKQFHHALVQTPEYMGIPSKDRSSCREFVELAIKLDEKSQPGRDEVEAAYVAAVEEARKLVAKGLLTLELPDEGPKDTSNTNTEASTTPPSHQQYEIHPTAAIFPMMSDEALDELAADIKEHDLRNPIVMHEGRVIDGRNRLEGCHRAGVEPRFEEWSGTGSVVAWIISVNVHRRHLSDQQRAMLAARIAQELAAETKERSTRNLSKSGTPVDGLDPGPSGAGRSAAQAAKLLNVSRDATNKAAKIGKDGANELVRAVTDGKVSLDAAAQVASLPKAKQQELVEKGKVQVEAKKIRNEKAASKASPKKAPNSEPIAESKDNEQPQPEPPPARKDEIVPPAAPKPPEAKPEDADEEDDTDDLTPATPEVRLLNEAHTELDKMVAAARRAGRMEHALKQLRNLVAHCQRMQVQYQGEASP